MTKSKFIYSAVSLIVLLSMLVLASCSDNVDKMRITGNGITCKAEVVINYSSCKSCDTCFRRCPEQAISKKDLAGWTTYIIDPDRCIKCGICIEDCPYNAISWKH